MVTLAFHLALRYNSGAPVPQAIQNRYLSALRSVGPTDVRMERGAWIGAHGYLFPDENRNVTVRMTREGAIALAERLLPQMRRDYAQEAELAEIYPARGPVQAAGASIVTMLRVTTANCASPQTKSLLLLLSKLAGGASADDEGNRCSVTTDVTPSKVRDVEAALRRGGYAPAATPAIEILR